MYICVFIIIIIIISFIIATISIVCRCFVLPMCVYKATRSLTCFHMYLRFCLGLGVVSLGKFMFAHVNTT